MNPTAHRPLEFPFPDLPATGASLPVAPGIAWVRMPLPFALDHINLWLVQDSTDDPAAVATVDTGYGVETTWTAWNSALAGRRLTRCIVTHGHPDHLGSARWLGEQYGAPLWISHAEYTTAQLILAQAGAWQGSGMIEFFAQHGLAGDRLDALAARGNSFKSGVPELPRHYRRIQPGDVLRIGAHDWQSIVGYGHTAEHLSFYCAALGVLISGDMLLPRISTNVPVVSMCPDDNPLQRFLDSIDRFLVLPEDTLVLPSHGRPFVGIHERVRQLHAHHVARCALLMEHCRTPRSAAELIPVLFDRDIPDPHQVMFAMGEAVAHLNKLWHEGALTRLTDAGRTRFVVS